MSKALVCIKKGMTYSFKGNIGLCARPDTEAHILWEGYLTGIVDDHPHPCRLGYLLHILILLQVQHQLKSCKKQTSSCILKNILKHLGMLAENLPGAVHKVNHTG